MEQIIVRILSGYYLCTIRNGKVQAKNAIRFESIGKIEGIIGKGNDTRKVGLLMPMISKESISPAFQGTIISYGHESYDEAMKAKAALVMANKDTERETQIRIIGEHIKSYEDPAETIIKSALLIEDLTRARSMLSNRLRNMLSAYYPEPSKEIEDSVALARIFLSDEKGMEKTPFARRMDETSRKLLRNTAKRIIEIDELIGESQEITSVLLKEHYPAFTAIATDKIAARILREVGGMRDIAFMPASKLQLIGAEKALFRHLRNKRNLPPKHGLIHEHPLMQGIPLKLRGKAARLIADKMTIAARLDYFKSQDKSMIREIGEEMTKKIRSLRGAE